MTRMPGARLLFVLQMYRRGFFPMADGPDRPLYWYYPRRRGIIPLDSRFHLSRSLAKTVRSGRYDVTLSTAFDRVLEECTRRESTWMNRDYLAFFRELHQLGVAHSMEAWQGRRLVGGLFGLSMGAVFVGESMFFRAPNASKVCLVHLVHRLRHFEYDFIDTQIINEHTAQFGAFEVPHEIYLEMLEGGLEKQRTLLGEVPSIDVAAMRRSASEHPKISRESLRRHR